MAIPLTTLDWLRRWPATQAADDATPAERDAVAKALGLGDAGSAPKRIDFDLRNHQLIIDGVAIPTRWDNAAEMLKGVPPGKRIGSVVV